MSPVAHLDAGVSSEARDPSTSRGPSRLTHAAASPLEKIRTIVVDDHQHIARLVANRIATLITEKQAAGERTVLGLATGSGQSRVHGLLGLLVEVQVHRSLHGFEVCK